VATDHDAFTSAVAGVNDQTQRWLDVRGTRSPDYFHRELGKIVWDHIGMERNQTGLEKAISEIPALRKEFENDVRVLGNADGLNTSLEKVGRIADFFELAETMARDALTRVESCGGHFRQESQTEEGEALRDDENFTHVTAWEYTGPDSEPIRHEEALEFEFVELTQRSYK
jgi:succinate dehydrogenase / fumarate reductase flavoprotein subunit